jgi:hypothetical protein
MGTKIQAFTQWARVREQMPNAFVDTIEFVAREAAFMRRSWCLRLVRFSASDRRA